MVHILLLKNSLNGMKKIVFEDDDLKKLAIKFNKTNIFDMNIFVVFALVILLIFFAIDSIIRLKKSVNETGFKAIPFGPALLIASFIILFYGNYITQFLKRYIFFI